MRTLVSQLQSKVGTEVTLYLTLEVLRDQKHLQFILGRDHTGTIQLVVSKSKVAGHEEISQLLPGSAFIVKGTAVETQQSKTFGIEIQVSEIKIVSKAEPYPITQDSSIDLRFDYRAVDLKTERSGLLFRVTSAFVQGCREFLLSKGLIEVSTPKILKSATEGGSQVFSVSYFEKTAYLAQSPQFAKQAAAMAFQEGIFEVAKVWRLEGQSSRHLCEFTSYDVEVPWLSLTEVMKLEEEMICYAFSKLERFKEDVLRVFGLALLTSPSVKYMTLSEAKQVLSESGKISLSEKQDLPDEAERMLYEILGKDLIFVSEYPIEKRPFYHVWEPSKGTTKSYDLLFRGLEITSGSERECSYEKVCKQAQEKGVTLSKIEDFLQVFKYGTPPTAGFGVGLERVVTKLLGLSSVKEAALFPKDPDRL